jgi:D-cysteine desulfhydrase
MTIPYPPRLPLARLPTPLEPLPRAGARLGVELWIKRDDLTGTELSGNKVRKLEFLLAEAREQGADTVLTCGGAQSNHCRATAIAATRLGLRSRLFLRVPDPKSPPPVEGNILLDRLAGAELVWITPADYARRLEVMGEDARRLAGEGRRPYLIPEGGSNALGAWGYVRAVEELAADLAALPRRPTTIVYAAGSGGTGAGLILGTRLFGLDARVVGVNVCDDRDYFVRVIGEICERTIDEHRLPLRFDRARDVEIVDGFVGRGYAQSRPEELARIRDLARDEGVFLDPVYTGKAFHGLSSTLEAKGRDAFGERIVFLHTGGIFGLFPKAGELEPLL